MKSIIIICLLTFSPTFLFTQNQDSISVIRAVDSLVQRGQQCFRDQKAEEAYMVLEQAKSRALDGLGRRAAGYANQAHFQATIYIKVGKFNDALPYCIIAKEIREKILGRDHLDYSQSVSYLANLYRELEQYDKAEPLALEAKELRAVNPGKTSREYAVTLHILGSVYHKQNQYQKAESYYLGAIDILSKMNDKYPQDYSIAVGNLAFLYFDWGKYDQVEALYLEAKDIQEKSPGKRSAAHAGTLNNLAWFYFKTGQYNKAEPYFIEATHIYEALYGNKHEAYISALASLAGFYYEIGQYGRAESLYLQALNLLGKSSVKKSRTATAVLMNLGVLYADLGQYAKAENNYLEAKLIFEESPEKNQSDYAMVLSNLGGLFYKKGQYVDAEKYLLQARSIRQVILKKEHPDYAASLHNLAELYSNYEQYAKAESLFLEAKDIYAKTLGLNHPSYANLLQNLAQLYTRSGDFVKAEPLFWAAKETFADSLSKRNPGYGNALKSLIDFYRGTNRFALSAPLLLELNNLDRNIIEKSADYFSEKEMLIFLKKYEEDLAEFYSYTQKHPDQEFLGTSFNNAFFYNGFLLENACQLNRAIIMADSLTRDTFYRWQGCRRRIIKEYNTLSSERILATEAEAETYEKALINKFNNFHNAFKAPDWKAIRNKLTAEEAAIELIRYPFYAENALGKDWPDDTMYAALILFHNDSTPHFVPLFPERKLLALLNPIGLEEESIIKDLYFNLPDLTRLLWTPLEPLLHNTKTIYYAPAGLLHRLNLAALNDESGASLSKNRQWVRLGSTRELLTGSLADSSFAIPTNTPSISQHSLLTALIYGGIDYNMDSLAYVRANPLDSLESGSEQPRKDGNFQFLFQQQPDNSSSTFRGIEKDSLWGNLTRTITEARQVNDILQKSGFDTELDSALIASEERIKKLENTATSPRILHFATHGFALDVPNIVKQKGLDISEPNYTLTEDPMLRSGLVLAGANFYQINKRPLTGHEDGMLVSYEVRDLNLQHTELAVLSACQTGLGDIVGSEGVYGLQRAFKIAGVKFLIVSLWHVKDEFTEEMMQLFYQNWANKHESLRDAFHNAQNEMREKYDNPYLWAGFVLIE